MGRSLNRLPQFPCTLLLSDSISVHRPSFQSGAVWQTFDAIKEVNRPEEIDWRTIPSMQTIAWKTGTSYGFRDAWAVGVTPKYAVGVWVGNATGEGKPGLVGARTAGPVLFDVFNLLPSSPWFERPQGELVEAEICRQSGHLKGRFCEETDTLLILPAGLKTEACLIITRSPYRQMNGSEYTRIVPIANRLSAVTGLPFLPYGNGIISNITRNIVLSLPLNQDVEKTDSNRCNLFIRQWEPVSICPNRWMAAKGS